MLVGGKGGFSFGFEFCFFFGLFGGFGLCFLGDLFFELFLETFAIDPAQAVYIDDLGPNVEAAAACGMHGILFTDPPALRSELVRVGLIPDTWPMYSA